MIRIGGARAVGARRSRLGWNGQKAQYRLVYTSASPKRGTSDPSLAASWLYVARRWGQRTRRSSRPHPRRRCWCTSRQGRVRCSCRRASGAASRRRAGRARVPGPGRATRSGCRAPPPRLSAPPRVPPAVDRAARSRATASSRSGPSACRRPARGAHRCRTRRRGCWRSRPGTSRRLPAKPCACDSRPAANKSVASTAPSSTSARTRSGKRFA